MKQKNAHSNNKNRLRKNCKRKFAGGGGVKNTELEIALAKKCLSLYDRLGQINNERKEYFEAIYSATIKFEEATKGTLKHKRAADLEKESRAHFAQAVKLDGELKELIDTKQEKE